MRDKGEVADGTKFLYNVDYNQNMMPKPDNYLVWAILSTICCCLPFGIVAIVYSSKVNALYAGGKYELACDASNKAKNWTIAAACTGLVVNGLYWVIWGTAALTQAFGNL